MPTTLRSCLVALIGCIAISGLPACSGKAGPPGGNGNSCSIHSNGDGTSTISCTDGTSATVKSGADGTPCTMLDNGNGTRTITCGASTVTVDSSVVDYNLMNAAEKSDSLMSAVVTSVTIPADGRPVVALKLSDRKGNGIKNLSVTAATWRFSLLKLVPGKTDALGLNGSANDSWVSYMPVNATSTASTETALAGSLTDNADGSYSYRFAKVINVAASAGTTYDANATHRLVALLYAPNNPFAPVNIVKDFIPATNVDVTGQNDKVDPAACLSCHVRFRANANAAGGLPAFHGGTRYDVRTCAACHNDQQRFTTLGTTATSKVDLDASGVVDPVTSKWTGLAALVNGEAFVNLPVFIHKLHRGEDLALNGGSYTGITQPYEIHFPQVASNCTKCHSTATLAANWKDKPSRRACNACHDGVSFAATVPAGRTAHSGGPQADDQYCTMCHAAGSSSAGKGADIAHGSVLPPDPNSTYSGGSNGNTNASYLAAAGAVPPGAVVTSYKISSVSRNAAKNPVIVFKLIRNGVDAPFNTFGTKTELFDGSIGSPSVYFSWAQPQDGIAAPADFNASASAYIKGVWNGSATTATLTGPDASNFYTITLVGTVIPDSGTMLTGGVGYTYALASTQPLTQTDLPAYPLSDPPPVTAGFATLGTQGGTACTATAPCACSTGSPCLTGKKIGGLSVPAPNVWAVATGYTGRRTIVASSKCNDCHAALGVGPTFHAGQRNDAQTCAFCHKPSQTSSAWSANAKDFIHGVHSADMRANPFGWHETSPVQGYWQVTYPGKLNNCESCHVAGSYDYSNKATIAAVPNMLVSTVGVGVYALPDTTSAAATSGFQGNVACSAQFPCACTALAPCVAPHSPFITEGTDYSNNYGTSNFTSGTSQSGMQGSTACTAGAPCTCTKAAPCVCTLAAPCEASPKTLVTSPIAAACVACHDKPIDVDHMKANGGSFYAPRSTVTGPGATLEQCLLCHGPNTVAAIADMHTK